MSAYGILSNIDYEKHEVIKLAILKDGRQFLYSGTLDKVEFVATLEMPYFGKKGNIMTEESYIATGRALGRAIKKFIETSA